MGIDTTKHDDTVTATIDTESQMFPFKLSHTERATPLGMRQMTTTPLVLTSIIYADVFGVEGTRRRALMMDKNERMLWERIYKYAPHTMGILECVDEIRGAMKNANVQEIDQLLNQIANLATFGVKGG